ncbi:MAG: hypothetical protein H0W10_06520, partial [Chloroflexi bacterium]|nr:hypothetical protein [Chloroflexota bacterium]
MGQTSTGTLRAFPQLALSMLAVVALVLSLFALANPVRATHTTSESIADGTIAVFKQMCASIGAQNTCNGRDTSLSGYHIDFTVQSTTVVEGTVTPGPIIHTITVTLGDNAGGGGNPGDGSQGRSIDEPFDIGT